MFDEAGIREAVPDAIPYDLRDSFAAHVGRAVRAGGGRVGEARDVARRLLGHGDGADVLSLYYDDDERHLELAEYTPLRLLKNGGAPVETGGKLVEIGGLEPTAEAASTHSTIPNALRTIAQGFVQLADALASEGGPLLDLAPVLHGLSNGRHSNRSDRPSP